MHTHTSLKKMANQLFALLQPGESLGLGYHGEKSRFLRFSQSRVRQATEVAQQSLSLSFQKNRREVKYQLTIGHDDQVTMSELKQTLEHLRLEASKLPEDPYFIAHQNHGSSESIHQARLPEVEHLLDLIRRELSDDDLAGIYCDGPLLSGQMNSLGLDHWFESSSFFFDYSLFAGEKASKGGYAGQDWDDQAFLNGVKQARHFLELLKRPAVDVRPGRYRTYLAPAAAHELVSILGWGGFSAGQIKRGQSALGKLYNEQKNLSPKLTLEENFSSGLVPSFNSLGELAPDCVPLIQEGRGVNMLVSSKSAAEYQDLSANGAGEHEGFRSLVIKPGELAPDQALQRLGTGLYLSNLHYLNYSDAPAGRVTGMTRYACFWVENGEIVGPIKDLRFDESLYHALGAGLIDLTTESEVFPNTSTYFSRDFGAMTTPGLLIEDFTFTL